jgi:SAM-dependent methyltransferase
MTTATKPIHPAPYSQAILRFIANHQILPDTGVVLDPMAGIGRVHDLAQAGRETIGIEIEPEWAACHPHTRVGNALALPFEDESIDAVMVSPVFGNRMSDSHMAKDGSHRRSYTHDLRRMTGDETRLLDPANSGTLYCWQPAYWRFHDAAWQEVYRVLRPYDPLTRSGTFVLNVSDCYRTHRGQRRREPVVETHRSICESIGFTLIARHEIVTPRMRRGANHESRAEAEVLLIFAR